MAIGPDGQEAMHVGMASFPHHASSRARPFAPIIDQSCARRNSLLTRAGRFLLTRQTSKGPESQ